jgi:hypothetical protein
MDPLDDPAVREAMIDMAPGLRCQIDSSRGPRPLFTTADDYVTATRRLIDRKKFNGE